MTSTPARWAISGRSRTSPGEWSATHERLRIQPEVLRRLIKEYEYQLKFVVAAPGDMDEIHRLIEDLSADRSKVILMAEGVAAAELRLRSSWLAEICKQEGFRFSPRLHVELYGNVRGT